MYFGLQFVNVAQTHTRMWFYRQYKMNVATVYAKINVDVGV